MAQKLRDSGRKFVYKRDVLEERDVRKTDEPQLLENVGHILKGGRYTKTDTRISNDTDKKEIWFKNPLQNRTEKSGIT